MARFGCTCGADILLKTGEEPHDAMLIPTRVMIRDFPDATELTDVEGSPPWVSKLDAQLDAARAVIYRSSRKVVFCDTCGRLWLQNEGSDRYQAYVPDTQTDDAESEETE